MTSVVDRALGRNADRPDVVLNKLTRWQWTRERKRVVRVCVVRNDDDTLTAHVIGDEAGQAVELATAEVSAVVPGRPWPVVQLADGTRWQLTTIGCGCNTPTALLGFHPLRSPYRALA